MTRIGKIAIALVMVAFPALAAGAEPQQDAAARFVAMVRAGGDSKSSEFRDALSAADAAKLPALASCEPGAPRTSESGTSIMIMWDCPGQPARQGVGTMLSFSDGKLSSVFVMGAVIVPVGASSNG